MSKATELAKVPIFERSITWQSQATIELRRLHEENAELREANETFGQRQAWWNDRMFALEQQRDVLLEALKTMLTHMGMDEDEWNKLTFDQARAAIKMTEEGK